jgi:hypothetical protein
LAPVLRAIRAVIFSQRIRQQRLSMTYDLLIKNGTVVDGSAPSGSGPT